MPPAHDHFSPLSVHRAFVVQFRLEADPSQGQWLGWVEHVASGQSAWFDSMDELQAFITRVLAQEPRSPSE